jgi:branched-chain amino acid transport system ATP-binding protein
MSHVRSGIPLMIVEHVGMSFGGIVANHDISFSVYPNEILGLIGPNGAGKTTLFNCLTGFYRPTVGRVSVLHPSGNRFYLEQMETDQISHKARVARTFQNIRLFGGMTVAENLMVAQHHALMRESFFGIGSIFRTKRACTAERQALDKARFFLDRVGLLDKANVQADALPYGERRLLEVARALCQDPLLLCLDEPAAGLNPKESIAFKDLLISLKQELNITMLLIEHDMGVVMKVCDHIVVLDHGEKIAEGSPDQIKNNPVVIAAYLGEEAHPC